MKKRFFSFGLILILFIACVVIPEIAFSAQESIINPTSSQYQGGDYGLNDILALATWAATWILGIVGSLTLLMFIYGGFIFLTSAGSNEKVSEAKKIITAAAVGLVIVFASQAMVRFVTSSLGLSWSGGKLEKSTVSSLEKNNLNTVITEETCLNKLSKSGDTLGSLGFRCVLNDQVSSEGYCQDQDKLCPAGKTCCAPSCSSMGEGYACTTNTTGKTCVDNLCKGSGKCCK